MAINMYCSQVFKKWQKAYWALFSQYNTSKSFRDNLFSKDRETSRQQDRDRDLSKQKHLGPDYEAFAEVIEHLHVKSHWLQLLISMRKGCTVWPLVR